MLTKIELQEKFRAKGLSFAQQKNLPKELKPLIAIANQISNSKGMSVEYPIIVKDQENMSSFIEFSGFIAINQDYVRNADDKIITRLKVCYLLDIDNDIKNFKLDWLRHDEFINIYVMKKTNKQQYTYQCKNCGAFQYSWEPRCHTCYYFNNSYWYFFVKLFKKILFR